VFTAWSLPLQLDLSYHRPCMQGAGPTIIRCVKSRTTSLNCGVNDVGIFGPDSSLGSLSPALPFPRFGGILNAALCPKRSGRTTCAGMRLVFGREAWQRLTRRRCPTPQREAEQCFITD
jgi:hypothetical protein